VVETVRQHLGAVKDDAAPMAGSPIEASGEAINASAGGIRSAAGVALFESGFKGCHLV